MALMLEVVFRKPMQLLIMLLIPVIIGFMVTYFLPVSYQATATLWALRAYQIENNSSLGGNAPVTPSGTQVDTISELLLSRTFVLAVARETRLESNLHLSSSIESDRQRVEEALFDNISHQVQVTSLGYNLFSITYNSTDPVVAQQIVKAVIHNYGIQSQSFSNAEGQILLQSYNARYTQAKQNLDAALAAESQYVIAHSQLKAEALQNDPHYSLLHSQTMQGQTTVDQLNSVITALNEQINIRGNVYDTLFKVVDTPVIPSHPASRVKVFLIGAGTGLSVGILGCLLYLLILVRRNCDVLDLREKEQVPLVVQIPVLKSEMKATHVDKEVHIHNTFGKK